jgi:uncharacterized repeat protein (TIGR01451 family)
MGRLYAMMEIQSQLISPHSLLASPRDSSLGSALGSASNGAPSARRQRMVVGWVLALLLGWIGTLVAVEPVGAQSQTTPITDSSPCFASSNLTNLHLSADGSRGITNQPVISGNGQRVAFWSVNNLGDGNADGNIEVFVGEAGSSSFVQLTDSVGSILGGFNLEPSINAAGTHIAFYSDRDLVAGQNSDGNFEIFLARRTSSGQWRITQVTTTDGSANLFPSINAAGDRIVFVSDDAELHNIDQNRANPERNSEIFLATVPASGAVQFRQITNTEAGITNDQPVISATGNRIAYTAGTGQTAQVLVWDSSNNTPTQLTQTDINDQPAINADGTRIVYIATNQDDRSRIVLHTLSVDGSESRAEVIVPTATNTKYRTPSISGNGERVAYVSEQGTGDAIQINVLLYDINTAQGVPISSVGRGTGEQPALSSDGTRVTFVGVQAVGGSTDDAGSDIYLNECPLSGLVLSFVTPPPTTVLAGVDVVYQLRVTNQGPSVATGAVFRSNLGVLPALPANVTRLLPSGCSIASNILTCSLGDIALNASRTFTIGYDIPSNAGLGDIVNRIEVKANSIDARPEDNTTGEFRTRIYEEADLSIAVTPDTSTILAGSSEILTYNIVIRNAGPSQARSASFKDTLPAGATFVSAALVSGGGAGALCPTTANDSEVLCQLGNLAAGTVTNIQIKIKAKASAPDSFVNVATVSSLTQESSLVNNTATTSTVVDRAADMSIGKVASPSGNVVAGREITYTIVVTNNGFADTTGVRLIDTMPLNVTYERNVSPAGTTCTPSGGGQVVTCALSGSVLVGQSRSLRLVGLVNSIAPAGTITNTARVFSSRRDPNSANDVTAPVTNTVTILADLVVTKTVNKSTPDVLENITYTVKVRNDGPSRAYDVVVTDTLPMGMHFVSASATQGSYSSGLWTVGTLAVGQERTLTLVAHALEGLGGTTVTNRATAGGSQPEPAGGLANSTASVDIVPQLADVRVTKSAAMSVTAGQLLTYTVTVLNDGPSLARSVSLTDVLPSDVFLIAATGPVDNPSCSMGSTITCTVGDMAANTQLTYTVVVTRELKGMITNTVTVGSLTPDSASTLGNNVATLPVTVNPEVPFRLVFTTQPPALVVAGDVFDPIPTVEIRDRYGNLIDSTIGATDEIRLQPFSNSTCTTGVASSGLVNGDVNAIGGVATFDNSNYITAGTIYLRAVNFTTPTTLSACSTSIAVNPAAVKKLVFTTLPRSYVAGQVSPILTVERRDEFDNTNSVGAFVATLSENSPSANTFLDANINGNTISTLSFADGEASASFFYTDTLANTYVITVSGPSITSPAVQTITVNAAGAKDLLVVVSAPPTATAGITSDLITVQRTDPYGNPNSTDPDVTVDLVTNSLGDNVFRDANDSTDVISVTIPFGDSTTSFRYQDTLAKTHTLGVTDAAGVLEGDTITITVVPSVTHRLLFTTTEQMITAGIVSDPIGVVRQDFYGNHNFADADLPVALVSTSTGFSSTFSPPSPVTIPQGSDFVTFTYSDTLVGTYDLTASAAGIEDDTQAITVTPDVPSQLAVLNPPYVITAGAPPITITLQRQDQFNNPAPAGGDLEIFLSGGSGAGYYLPLGASDEITSAITSVTITQTDVSFLYSDKVRGVYQLNFFDNNNSEPFDTSQELIINAAVATKLVFTQVPVTVTAGVGSGLFVVERQDEFNNADINSGALTVDLTSTSDGGYSFRDGVTGMATTSIVMESGVPTATFYYNDMRAGVHTITAVDSGATLTPAITPITVGSAVANKLVFINPSRTITAGSVGDPLLPLVVQVQDQFSNPVTPTVSAPVTVTLSANEDKPFAKFRNAANSADITFIVIAGSSTGSFLYYDEQVGSPAITADNALGLSPDADIVTVVAAPADHLAFVTGPMILTAGITSTQMTVQRLDPFNNPNTTDPALTLTLATTSTAISPAGVRFISGTVDVALPSNQLVIGAGRSQASFRYYDTVRAQPMITVTAPLTVSTVTQRQTVLGAAAVRLRITGIASQVAGTPQQLGLFAYDSFGNRADPYTGAHTLTFNGAAPSPSGQAATVTNNSSAPVNFGTGTAITFTAGVATVGGSMTLYKAAVGTVITATDTVANVSATGADALTVTVTAATRTKVGAESASNGTGNVVPDQSIGAGGTLTLWAVGRDSYNNVTGNAADATWTITATGGVSTTDIAPTAGVSTTFTARQVGTAVIEPRVSGVASTPSGLITVVPALAATVRVETAADGSGTLVTAQSLVAGSTLTVFAVTRDSVGNYVGNPPANWTIVTGTTNVNTGNNLAPVTASQSTVFTAKQVGSGHIRASVVGVTSRDSGLITVTAGPAARFGVTNSGSTSVTAGDARTWTITAFDLYSNTAISYTGVHALTFSGPLSSTRPVTPPTVVDRNSVAKVIGTPTELTFVSGVAVGASPVGNVTFYHAPLSSSAVTLTVSDGSINGSRVFNVAASLQNNKISIESTTGTNLLAGVPVSLTLSAEDSYGNLVTSYGGSKQLRFTGTPDPNQTGFPATVRSSLGTEELFEANTTISFVGGVATASGGNNGVMKLYKIGTYVISTRQANNTYLSGASGSLTVTVSASPSQNLMLALPASSVNRSAFQSPSTVTLKDIFGNIVPQRPVTITTSLPGSITIAGSNNDNVLSEAGENDFNASGVANLAVDGLGMTYAGMAGNSIFTAMTASPLGGTLVATDSVAIIPAAPVAARIQGSTTVTPSTNTLYVTSGMPISLTISLYDVDNNLATTVSSMALDFALTPSGSSPSATVTDNAGATVNVNGNATINFVGGIANSIGGNNGVLRIYKVGTYTLKVSNANPITTEDGEDIVITVVPGPLAELDFAATGPQTNATTFTNGTVTARDASDNIITNFNQRATSVTITQSAAPTGTIAIVGSANGDNILEPADFVNGVATLNTLGLRYIGLAGSIDFRAVAGAIVGTPAAAIEIVPGSLASLVLSGPSAVTAGSNVIGRLRSQDISGNAVNNALSVTFSGASPAPNATVPSVNTNPFNVAFGVTPVGGNVALTFVLPDAGSVLLQATNGVINSNQLAVTVSPTALASFSLDISASQVLTTALTGSPNTITALDSFENIVTTFEADTNPVTITRSQGNEPYLITGLGGAGHLLDQASDFTEGVAGLTGRLIYEAAVGELVRFTATAGTIIGESNEVSYTEP